MRHSGSAASGKLLIPAAAAFTFAFVYALTPPPAVPAEPQPVQAAAETVAVPPRPAAMPASPPEAVEAPAPGPSLVEPARPAPSAPARRAAVPSAVEIYYPGCNAVRAAGAAPLYEGEPGYRVEMDGDRDGIACEPRRRGW